MWKQILESRLHYVWCSWACVRCVSVYMCISIHCGETAGTVREVACNGICGLQKTPIIRDFSYRHRYERIPISMTYLCPIDPWRMSMAAKCPSLASEGFYWYHYLFLVSHHWLFLLIIISMFCSSLLFLLVFIAHHHV